MVDLYSQIVEKSVIFWSWRWNFDEAVGLLRQIVDTMELDHTPFGAKAAIHWKQ